MSGSAYRGAAAIPDGLLKVLGEKYSVRILEAACRRPCAAGDLIEQYDIPRTTVYRRLKSLEAHDLVTVEGRLDRDGAHDRVFHCNLEQLRLDVEDGTVTCDLELRDDPEDTWAASWHMMRRRDEE